MDRRWLLVAALALAVVGVWGLVLSRLARDGAEPSPSPGVTASPPATPSASAPPASPTPSVTASPSPNADTEPDRDTRPDRVTDRGGR